MDVCSETERTLKTVSVEEQMMSKDKYPRICSKSNGGYCVFIILHISVFATRGTKRNVYEQLTVKNARGNSPIKMTGVLVGNFEKNPQKVPESRFVGVAQINFHPYEQPGDLLEKPILKHQINWH